MSSLDDNSFSNHTDKLTVITDSDGIPVKVDNNPAHFDGFVQEIEDYSRRTGVFLPYFEHGMVMRGSKTITDSAASVPFLMGMVTNVKVYSARDPCPPTAKRVADHNDAMEASTPKRSTIEPQKTVPADVIINQYLVQKEGLDLGNSIAACFEDSKYIHRIREGGAMNGRDLIAKLLSLGSRAEPAERSLVISRFTNLVEKPVLITIDEKSFDDWYTMAVKMHRRMPRASHKSDADWCEYLNVLFYSQPTWRENFELKMGSAPPGTEGNLDLTLELIRKMLTRRQIYSKLDAERNGAPANVALVADNGGGARTNANEGAKKAIQRVFLATLAGGDTAGAFAVASQAGLNRATFDPNKNKNLKTENNNEKEGDKFVELPRDASGAITEWVPNALPCFCGGKHLYRDCPITDAWNKSPNGKWLWKGGKGWKNGCHPVGYTGPGANQAKPVAAAPKQAAKVVTLESYMSDSDIAARLRLQA